MPRFMWRDRYRCLFVIVNTMKCRRDMNVDEVIERVLHKADAQGYWYCRHPEAITAEERTKLRNDALVAYAKYGPIMKWGKPANVGNIKQAK